MQQTVDKNGGNIYLGCVNMNRTLTSSTRSGIKIVSILAYASETEEVSAFEP